MQGNTVAPAPTPVIVLSAAGAHGAPGTQAWDGSNNFQAPQGSPGRHGRDAAYPTPGGSAGSLHVSLGYDPSRPGFVLATGESDRLVGQQWEVGGKQTLLLDCRGGDGGAGGVGEFGQAGGDGFHGRDATRFSEASVSNYLFIIGSLFRYFV